MHLCKKTIKQLDFPKIRSNQIQKIDVITPASEIVKKVFNDLETVQLRNELDGNVEQFRGNEIENSIKNKSFKKQIISGALFYGNVNNVNFNGPVYYTTPEGVTFEGNMKDGLQEGDGVLTFANGSSLHGTWHQGNIVHVKKYIYSDGLTRPGNDKWDYCTPQDRRFYSEILNGVQVGSKAQITNDVSERAIPSTYYKFQEGYLDVTLQWILHPKTLQPLRQATKEEICLAVSHCRRGWQEHVDFQISELNSEIICHQGYSNKKEFDFNNLYRNVPGLEKKQKSYKLERKLQALTYKINHNIATDEEKLLFQKLKANPCDVLLESSHSQLSPSAQPSQSHISLLPQENGEGSSLSSWNIHFPDILLDDRTSDEKSTADSSLERFINKAMYSQLSLNDSQWSQSDIQSNNSEPNDLKKLIQQNMDAMISKRE